jgi:hypothetical protein
VNIVNVFKNKIFKQNKIKVKINLKIMNNLLKNLLNINSKNIICRKSSFILKEIHEPKYLDYLKPQIPYYPLLNIQVFIEKQLIEKTFY